MSVKVSDAPWDGSASRYSDDQWKAACLVDHGTGSTAKQRYGVPVREPDGTLNRRGMAAAAGALSGARSPIKAPAEAIAAARRKLHSLYSQAGMTLKTDIDVPIWKSDDAAEQNVYGVVLQPGVTDSQGDVVNADEIAKAAHRFLTESRKSDVQHNEEQADVQVIESYVAPHDMVVAGKPVLKGSWVMGSHIADPEIWGRVEKGEITGYSIGGTGIRKDEGGATRKSEPTQLSNLDVEWVSLVDRAAVRDPVQQSEPMRFLIYKRDGDTPNYEGERMSDDMKEALDKAEKEATDAKAEVETLKSELESVKADLAKATEAGENDDADDDDDNDENRPVNKSELPANVRAALEKAEADAKVNAEKAETAEKIAKEEREIRVNKEFVEKAESLKGLPGDASEVGPLMKALSEGAPEAWQKFEDTVLKAASKQIEEGELFKSLGADGDASQRPGNAESEALAKAEKLRKDDPSLSEGEALTKALESDKELEARYAAEMQNSHYSHA